ncbi:MAG: hypothetical protein JNJ71_04830 [Rubrivivax sp.]|nr:hypothetical protein [Rubrivivax sp.]
MGRLLILVLIVGLGAWWIYARITRRRQAQAADTSVKPTARAGEVQDMVACAHCGVHLPRGEALLEGDRAFCGEAHRRLGPRA